MTVFQSPIFKPVFTGFRRPVKGQRGWLAGLGGGTVTAKSVVFDFIRKHGTRSGMRSIEFLKGNSVIPLTTADFTAYEIGTPGPEWDADYVFDTTTSKTGTDEYNSWFYNFNYDRIIIVFNTPQSFDGIRFNNYHVSGTNTSYGIRDIKVSILQTPYSTMYAGNTIEGVEGGQTILYDQIPEHVASDVVDDQDYTNLILPAQGPVTAKSVIFLFQNNYHPSGVGAAGVRSIEFKNDDTLINLTNTTDFTAYAYSNFSSGGQGWRAFDTGLSKTGSFYNTGWYGNGLSFMNNLIIVFDTPQTFDEIVFNNFHDSGNRNSGSAYGAKWFDVFITNATYTDTNLALYIRPANTTHILSGKLQEHALSDAADDQSFLLGE